MKKLAFAIKAILLFCSTAAVGQAQIATVFRFPTDNYEEAITNANHYLLFGELNPNFQNWPHAGEDIRVTVHNMEVKSVAAGKIVFARYHADCPNWGFLVVIEHTLPDNSKVCSIYGHLDESTVRVSEGQTINQPGIFIGKTGTYSCWEEHLHFGIYDGPYRSRVGRYDDWLAGYLKPKLFPGNYVKPSEFIYSHFNGRTLFDGGLPDLGGFSVEIASDQIFLIAADFELPSNSSLTGITFWTQEGIFRGGPSFWDGTVSWFLFVDDNGFPGSSPFAAGFGTNVRKKELGPAQSLETKLYKYKLDLPHPVQLIGHTKYWLSIRPGGTALQWMSSRAGFGSSIRYSEQGTSFPVGWFTTSGDVAFQVVGN